MASNELYDARCEQMLERAKIADLIQRERAARDAAAWDEKA